MPMMINMKKFLKRMIKISIRINKSYQIKIDSIINSLKSKRKTQKKKKFLWCQLNLRNNKRKKFLKLVGMTRNNKGQKRNKS